MTFTNFAEVLPSIRACIQSYFINLYVSPLDTCLFIYDFNDFTNRCCCEFCDFRHKVLCNPIYEGKLVLKWDYFSNSLPKNDSIIYCLEDLTISKIVNLLNSWFPNHLRKEVTL